MINLTKPIAFFLSLISIGIATHAQIKEFSVANAHSHNDYKNDIPFYRAYNKGFGSIEADVYAVDGQLMVGHNKNEINAKRSLKILYIDPLAEKFKHDETRQLRLLIEIKEDHKAVLPLVIKELEPLKKYITYPGQPGRLSIVMTGAIPPAAELGNYPDWITFDTDHLDGYTTEQWQRIGLVSFPFTRYTKWDGKGVLASDEITRVKGAIDSVHSAGKMVRFWATPDTKSSWVTLIRLGVDVLGTDKIEELGDFLKKKPENE